MEHHCPQPGFPDHEEINGVLEQISKATGDLDSLRPLLGDLRPMLTQHFTAEEADDGLFDTIGTRAPRLGSKVQECLQEHQELLTALGELMEQAEDQAQAQEQAQAQARARGRAQAGPGEGMTEIQGDAESFLKKLRDHEAKETELLNDSMFLDLGGGD
ncbi:MAG: hemerythrin domain-containing protein [Planctomycetota bacterium]|jgi:hypothetical protein